MAALRYSKVYKQVLHYIKRGLLLACFLLLAEAASAQMFAPLSPSADSQEVSKAAAPVATPARPAKATAPRQNAGTVGQQKTDDENVEKMPQLENRGAFQLRFIGNNVEIDTKPKILLYARDFKISRNMNGSVNCTMRFYVMSTMKEKITNISYRLKWPDMETALSFNDVPPNTPNYFDYSLLGNGCYNMDKAPNVIVNRCRIKGMTQRECADAIRWLN